MIHVLFRIAILCWHLCYVIPRMSQLRRSPPRPARIINSLPNPVHRRLASQPKPTLHSVAGQNTPYLLSTNRPDRYLCIMLDNSV